MTKVKVIQVAMFRDGGTVVYADEHNRRYYIPGNNFNDKSIYCEYPRHHDKSDLYRDQIRVAGIELEIVEKF